MIIATTMRIGILAVLLPALCLASVSDYLSNDDKASMKALYSSAKPYTVNDLQSLYYSVSGLNLLGEKIPEEKPLCELLNKDAKTRDVAQLYFTILSSQNVPSCKITLPVSVETVFTAALASASSTKSIYYSVFSLVHLNLKVDTAKVILALKTALKADDSPLSHAYAFYSASLLKTDVKYFFELIEDIIAQADEIDSKFMQFEAGVFTTSMLLDSSYKLAASVNKEPSTLRNKIEKFTNYLLARKHTDSLRNSATLLSVFKTLSVNKFHVPLVVALESSIAVTSKDPNVKVRVSTVMGTPINVNVNMESVKSVKQSAVIISKKEMTPSSSDKSIYQLDLISSSPNAGFYLLSIVVTPKDKQSTLIGLKSNNLKVKVTTKVTFSNVKVAVSERDAPSILIPVTYPSKLSKSLEADSHQSIVVNFQVISTKDKTLLSSIHQTFVCFTNIKTKQAITFIAQNTGGTYKFKIDMNDKEKDFDYISGTYSIEIIVGDSIIENSIIYNIGSIKLKLNQKDNSDKSSLYSMKPEITHTFRVPDKRPLPSITNVFNILVIVPAIILVIMWLRIGVNISNITQICTFSAIGFQAGLISIFVLYYYYWVQLNMFETLRYLGYLSVPTFLFGNSVLRSIASKRK